MVLRNTVPDAEQCCSDVNKWRKKVFRRMDFHGLFNSEMFRKSEKTALFCSGLFRFVPDLFRQAENIGRNVNKLHQTVFRTVFHIGTSVHMDFFTKMAFGYMCRIQHTESRLPIEVVD